jgi:hypothetical protein
MAETSPPDEDFPLGGTPTEEQLLFAEIGREQIKRSIPALNEALQRLVTLNAGLLGGSLVFLKPELAPAWSRWPAIICFFFSLFVAIWGGLPHPADSRFQVPRVKPRGFSSLVS